MSRKLPTILIMTIRLTGVLALLLGGLLAAGVSLPLAAHLAPAFFTLLAVFLLASIGLRQHFGLAVAAFFVALVAPLFGLNQVQPLSPAQQHLSMALHPLLALTAMGLSEALAKRLRQ